MSPWGNHPYVVCTRNSLNNAAHGVIASFRHFVSFCSFFVDVASQMSCRRQQNSGVASRALCCNKKMSAVADASDTPCSANAATGAPAGQLEQGTLQLDDTATIQRHVDLGAHALASAAVVSSQGEPMISSVTLQRDVVSTKQTDASSLASTTHVVPHSMPSSHRPPHASRPPVQCVTASITTAEEAADLMVLAEHDVIVENIETIDTAPDPASALEMLAAGATIDDAYGTTLVDEPKSKRKSRGASVRTLPPMTSKPSEGMLQMLKLPSARRRPDAAEHGEEDAEDGEGAIIICDKDELRVKLSLTVCASGPDGRPVGLQVRPSAITRALLDVSCLRSRAHALEFELCNSRMRTVTCRACVRVLVCSTMWRVSRACVQVDDCGVCNFCKDKPRFGGRGTKRQKCVNKRVLGVGPVRTHACTRPTFSLS